MLPLWDKLGRRRSTPVTSGLVALILAVFVAQVALLLLGESQAGNWFNPFALVPSRWLTSWNTWQGWVPVFTSSLLHGGLAHVAGNLWFLWVFGRSLEEHVGSGHFLILYLIGAAGAALAQIAAGPGSNVPMVGASGAISAVMGAYFILLPTRWIVSLVPWIVPILPVPAVVFLVLWFAMQLTQGLDTLGHHEGGGVAWWAHAGGFVVGAAWAWLFAPTGTPKPKRAKRSGR